MSTGKPASGNLEPALRGEAALRLPRLLFGDGAAVKAFLPWHAELLQCLGRRARGICAAWRLAGSETDPVHIILCVSREQLLLVDLNRKKEKATRTRISIRAKAGLKIDHHMQSSLQMMKRTASKLKRQQQQLRRKSSRRQAVGKKTTVMPLHSLYSSQWSQLSLPSGRMLRPGMLTSSLLKRARGLPGGTWQFCTQCRRGDWWRMEGESAEEVIASWSWSEVRGIEAVGGPKQGQLSSWTLCITAASGIDDGEELVTEWPLLGEVVPAHELQVACRGVRKAMLELGRNQFDSR